MCFGEMSVPWDGFRRTWRFGSCLFGELLFGELYIGEISSGNYLPEKCPSGNYLTNQEVCQRRTCQTTSVIYRYIFVSEWGFASTPSSKGKSHWVIIGLVSTQLCTVPSVVLYTLIPPWHFWYLFIVFSTVLSDVTVWLRNYPSWKKN